MVERLPGLPRQLGDPFLNHRHARVDVVSGGAEIQFEAKAQTSGRHSDTVVMMNPMNGHMFRAVVVDSGRVEVRATAKDLQ